MKSAFIACCFLAASISMAKAGSYAPSDTSSPQIQSITLEGGPIATQHFQSGDVNANQNHYLAITRVETKDYGNWGIYYLSPNSEDRTSVGAGYITDPYTVHMGPTRLELTGAIGVVTGYEYAVVPLLAAQARFVFYDNGHFNAGLSAAALPYVMEDNNGKNKFGIVATVPFLSLQYRF